MVCFNVTFVPNGSDERQWSVRKKVVGHWFESGLCVGPFRCVWCVCVFVYVCLTFIKVCLVV